MCRFIKFLFLTGVINFLLVACTRPAKPVFTKAKEGYWYRLIAYTNEQDTIVPARFAWVQAVFSTQKDSVFYDTQNDLKDRFFIRTDTSHHTNFLKTLISHCIQGDSLCVLIPPKDFFSQQFKSPIPLFCKNDSVVKINLKIKQSLTKPEYEKVVKKIANKELEEIESFFKSVKDFELAKDPLGFYWVEKPSLPGTVQINQGDQVIISYEGGFLNGRIIDHSPPGFRLIYGTPDQLLKGLNYVMARLKKGQTSKIILPSHLAFGENGSTNGSVPPFTPMLYKITIIDIKN